MTDRLTRLLLVEDDEQYAEMIMLQMKSAGYDVTHASSGAEALTKLESGTCDLILSDILMPGMSGLEMLDEIERRGVAVPVIVMSAYGSVDTAIQALKKGAYDYVSKPFKKDELLLAIRKLEEREMLRRTIVKLEQKLRHEEQFDDIVGQSAGMREVFAMVRKVAPYRTTILVTGESGTGKELVARALHRNSRRVNRPFVVLNCAAIPEQLLESELFGHVRGAFTDAHAEKKGLFEEADGGTLFLDEIGELPLSLQVKLLRTLQDGVVRKLGATKSAKVDVRLIAATAQRLDREVEAGKFREDLYYRLNVVQITLPPLRDRVSDIEQLISHFIRKTNQRLGTEIEAVDVEARKALLAYSWPGNVRELENAIERASVLSDGVVITRHCLPDKIAGLKSARPRSEVHGLSIKKAVRALEEDFIRAALLKTGGNRTQAAKILEISHRALLYKIREYGVDVPHA